MAFPQRGPASGSAGCSVPAGQDGEQLEVLAGQTPSTSPGEFARALLEGAGRAVLADGCHPHDDLYTLLHRLPGPAERSEVSSSEAGLDRIELDHWKCLCILNGEHRDGGLA